MIVVIDNTDKSKRFLPKLISYLETTKVPFVCVRTIAELKIIPIEEIHGFILTGSNIHIENMSLDMLLANSYPFLIKRQIPILGICLGAQFIQRFFDGKLSKFSKTFCKINEVICTHPQKMESLMQDIPMKFKAQFCLNYPIQNGELAKELQTLCISKIYDKEYIVGFKHETKSIYGFLYHPEELQETHKILDNFINLVKMKK